MRSAAWCGGSSTTFARLRDHDVPLAQGSTASASPRCRSSSCAASITGRSSPEADRRSEGLEGERVGVNRGYTVTTGVWARGILADEYGVDLDKVTWVLSGDEHVAEYRPPANVVPLRDREGSSASWSRRASSPLRSASSTRGLVPLIPGAGEAGFEALRRRGHYPINHLVVVRDELLEADPDLAGAVFDAFAEAKNLYVQRLRDGALEASTATDRMYERVLQITGKDPLPYGIEPNRSTIEQLIDHAVSQKILARRPSVESLFAPGTAGREAQNRPESPI